MSANSSVRCMPAVRSFAFVAGKMRSLEYTQLPSATSSSAPALSPAVLCRRGAAAGVQPLPCAAAARRRAPGGCVLPGELPPTCSFLAIHAVTALAACRVWPAAAVKTGSIQRACHAIARARLQLSAQSRLALDRRQCCCPVQEFNRKLADMVHQAAQEVVAALPPGGLAVVKLVNRCLLVLSRGGHATGPGSELVGKQQLINTVSTCMPAGLLRSDPPHTLPLLSLRT